MSVYIRYPANTGGGGGAPSGPAGGDLGGTYPDPTVPGLHGSANHFAGFNGSGDLSSIPNWLFNSTTGEAQVTVPTTPDNLNIFSINSDATADTFLNAMSVNLNNAVSGGSISGVRIDMGDADAQGGNLDALQINMSSATSTDPQGPTAISADGRIQINSETDLVSTQTFQIGSRIGNLFHVPSGSPVTGTDSLNINIAGDLWAEDNVAVGPVGLGYNAVGFIGSVAVNAGKTIDSLTVFLPASALADPGVPTGGTITNFHMIRTFAPLDQGGTAVIANLYGLKIDDGFGAFHSAAVNAWGIYVEDPLLHNHFAGLVDMGFLQLNGSTSGVLSHRAAATTTNHTLTWPAAQGTGVLTNNGSGTLSWGAAGGLPAPLVTTLGYTNYDLGASGTLLGIDSATDTDKLLYLGSTDVTSGNSSSVALVSGTVTAGSGTPAAINIFSGWAAGSGSGIAGANINMVAGSSNSGTGGGITITSGGSTSAGSPAGEILINAGITSNTNGANVTIQGGQASGNTGGNVILMPGTGSIAGHIDASSSFIKNVADPVDPQDAATKAYVDSSVGNPFKFYASSQVTTASGNVTSGTFTTVDNSPALSFTPTITGTYKVYSSVPVQVDSGSDPAAARIVLTSGSGTLLQESQGSSGSALVGTLPASSSIMVQSVYTLTASVAYVFDIQVRLTGATGGQITTVRGDYSPFHMFAERCG